MASREKITPQAVRVLVVEDDANNRLVVTRLLRLAGVQAENILEVEGDPFSTLSETQLADIHLVLLDLQLPKKDGYAILRDFRSKPALDVVRVVALTANVMRSDVERARNAGFDGFIGKPIDGRRFTDILNRLLADEAIWTITL
jgi:two-component system cell cycle response regulator DivK